MNKHKLEAVIDALTDSLEIVQHNPAETEYVLTLRDKYEKHYKSLTGRYYRFKDIKPCLEPLNHSRESSMLGMKDGVQDE
jgi:hypothetical protein